MAAAIELTVSQRTLLQALVELYREEPVKGKHVAERVDRDPGTVRNHMQSLKALQLVEGITGPNGGYRPTGEAYDVLDVQQLEEPADVPIQCDGRHLEGATVAEIALPSVHHPDTCRAEIELVGSTEGVRVGRMVTVGPTPTAGLQVTGEIAGVDESRNRLVVAIKTLRAPVEQTNQ